MFTREEMNYNDLYYGIQLIKSTPFYAQANGKVETSNKVLIGILEKMLEENPRDWLMILAKTLWAYRTSKRSSTRVSPFFQIFGQNVVLLMEVVVPYLRVSRKNGITPQEYSEAMMMELKYVNNRKIQASNH